MFRDWVYPAYARVARPKKNKKRTNTAQGRFIQNGTIVCAFLGLNTDVSFVYQLFAFLFCLTLTSRIALRIQNTDVTIVRHLPRYATAFEAFEYQIEIENLGERTEKGLWVLDNPTIVAPSREQFRHQQEPNEESRNAYDRFIGYHRFIYLQRLNTGLVTKPEQALAISRKTSVNVTIHAQPKRRGIVRFSTTNILYPEPLNLNHGIKTFENPESLMVLPKRYDVSGIVKPSNGRHFQPGGINSAWSIGESDEFVSLRDYRDGDPMRRIHWSSTAKRGKPVVKEYQDEYFVRSALVLDTSSDDAELLEEAISLAASFTFALNEPDSVLDLIYLSNKQEILSSGRGTNSRNSQLEALATLQSSKLDICKLTEVALNHARLMSSCIIILSKWSKAHELMVKGIESAGVPLDIFIVTKAETEVASIPKNWHILPIDDLQASLRQI